MTDAPPSPRYPSNAGHDGREQLDRFFDWIRSSGITRGGDRWLAGVCGGIARRTGLDPMIVRGAVIVLAILGGPVLIAYALGWAFLPDAAGRIHAEQLFRGIFEPAMVVIFALILFTFVPFTRGLWWQGPPDGWGMPGWLATTLAVGWAIAVTIGVIWLVVFLLRRIPAGGYGASWPADGPAAPTGTGSGSGTAAGTTGAGSGAGSASFAATGARTPGTGTDDIGGTGIGTADATWLGAQATGSATADAGTPVDGVSGDGGTGTGRWGAAGSAYPTAAPPRPDAQAPRSAWDAWQEQNRHWQAQHRAWRAEQRAQRAHYRWQHRHPGAGFTAIVLGFALAVGAVAAGVYSAGTWSSSALLVGVAFTLGVLALGIIVSGIRGRDSGAMGGFAFLAVLTLLFVGVFPQGTQFSPFGDNHWVVSSSSSDATPSFAMIAGNPTVDLSDLSTAGRSDTRTIDVWLGFGATDVILPADRSVRVETNSIVGGVDYGDDHSNDQGGVLFHDARSLNGNPDRPVASIRIWSLVGQVDVHTITE
ncbi:PspC domain-containing protein [Glaciibacter sp. 2TAF33]|uniref:PspC domain-containing protein n=1 Tax=Glaciibacter sp. 2TAF33 TaxID=3233015 RepID=UPI003F8FBE7F